MGLSGLRRGIAARKLRLRAGLRGAIDRARRACGLTGAFLGGQLTAWLGFAHMFFVVGVLLLGSAFWCKTRVVDGLAKA